MIYKKRTQKEIIKDENRILELIKKDGYTDYLCNCANDVETYITWIKSRLNCHIKKIELLRKDNINRSYRIHIKIYRCYLCNSANIENLNEQLLTELEGSFNIWYCNDCNNRLLEDKIIR
jgi:hypothetical protein